MPHGDGNTPFTELRGRRVGITSHQPGTGGLDRTVGSPAFQSVRGHGRPEVCRRDTDQHGLDIRTRSGLVEQETLSRIAPGRGLRSNDQDQLPLGPLLF